MSTVERLVLDNELTIYHALALKQQLMQALERCQMLELDLSHVSDMDTAGLQLLLLTKREAARTHKRLALVAHNPVVRQTLDFCNLASYFGDPMVIPAQEREVQRG